MANQRSASQQNKKKLPKRERRVQQRLQEAQAAYTKAMDRFKRASALLQKRRKAISNFSARG